MDTCWTSTRIFKCVVKCARDKTREEWCQRDCKRHRYLWGNSPKTYFLTLELIKGTKRYLNDVYLEVGASLPSFSLSLRFSLPLRRCTHLVSRRPVFLPRGGGLKIHGRVGGGGVLTNSDTHPLFRYFLLSLLEGTWDLEPRGKRTSRKIGVNNMCTPKVRWKLRVGPLSGSLFYPLSVEEITMNL